jgi:hypothetical protein
MRPITRRRFVQAGAAAGAGLVLGRPAPRAAAASPVGFAERFLEPARAVRPRLRWWWPHGLVDSAEIRREIDQSADAGFGGVEIADVHHSATAPLDPAGHGWGTPAWNAAVEAALDRARARALAVDARVSVNGGEPLAVDPAIPVVDVGPALVAGANTIEVEVATMLLNRLRVTNPAVFGAGARQRYGLIGPVWLVPYGQMRIV